ncbi:Gluconolactonase [Geodia barretti]|uniref:Gluconolactonase n=1 Tax=Geodia barretti TaxID=519541 RepID=A0AA35SN98_GEOBA|nr:Gluconolactonase [Geodia barretti]
MSWDFELVAGPYGGTTEGAVWDGEAVIFSHIPASRLLRYDPRTGETTEYFTNVNHVNGLCFDVSGNLFGCQQGGRRIVRFEKDGQTITSLPHMLDGKRHNNPNDLVVDRSGRIWFTDPYSGIGDSGPQELDHMSVLRLDPTGDGDYELSRVTTDISRPNGVIISRDQKTLYVAQSDYGLDRLRELRAYPINDDGSLGQYETLHTFGVDHRGAQRGVDGMTLDTDGNIIACAGWESGGPGPMIYVFSPEGRVLETHPIRAERATNCCFGDADMKTLYVTTGGGHLFRARTDHTGWIMWP